jgi:hypothetical protein
MKFFLKKCLLFVVFFKAIFVVLLVFDWFIYDRISNSYLNQAFEEPIENLLFIGSSFTKWSAVDSLLPKATYLAEGGQYAYGSITVFHKLQEKGLIKGKNIILDLVARDEIKNGNGQWWYFSEIFLKSRLAKFTDYPVELWPDIYCRIVKDITHFGKNEKEKFRWEALDKVRGNHPTEPNEDTVWTRKENFYNCTQPLHKEYKNVMLRFASTLDEVEKKFNCKVYILTPPYPAMCLNDYKKIFGAQRLLDLSSTVEYNITDFWDNGHLNGTGAIKYSKKLNQMLTDLGIGK